MSMIGAATISFAAAGIGSALGQGLAGYGFEGNVLSGAIGGALSGAMSAMAGLGSLGHNIVLVQPRGRFGCAQLERGR